GWNPFSRCFLLLQRWGWSDDTSLGIFDIFRFTFKRFALPYRGRGSRSAWADVAITRRENFRSSRILVHRFLGIGPQRSRSGLCNSFTNRHHCSAATNHYLRTEFLFGTLHTPSISHGLTS